MLERLRMQEVSQIILTVPEGAVIAGTGLKYGDPIMIIDKPATSQLTFTTNGKKNEDQGFISKSTQTKQIDFTINDGSILYSVWSYLHGVSEEHASSTLRGTEYLELTGDEHNLLLLSAHNDVSMITVYKNVEGQLIKLTLNTDYIVYYIEDEQGIKNYYVELYTPEEYNYMVSYLYTIEDVQTTKLKQLHNNIFATLDVYFDAVDVATDDKHVVCLHCDKVQIFTDLAIGINNSRKASFTPIEIHSIATGNELNKDIATITVI